MDVNGKKTVCSCLGTDLQGMLAELRAMGIFGNENITPNSHWSCHALRFHKCDVKEPPHLSGPQREAATSSR